MVSCRTSRPNSSLSNERDSIYIEIEKLIPVQAPADSAAIRALLECDENGKIALKWLDMANTRNVQLLFRIDSLGNLLANFKVPSDTVYLPIKETSLSVNKKKEEIKVVKVEKKLNKWQSFCIYFTIAVFIGIGIKLILFIRRKFKA